MALALKVEVKLVLAAVYTGLALMANPVLAGPDEAAALRAGDMKKLVFAETLVPLPEVALVDETEAARTLAEYRGSWLVVNFWATWCAPCRVEMPTLAALQTALDGQPVEVVTIATGRNPPPAIDRFFGEIGVDNLPQLRDPTQALARQLGVFGLPTTLIVDPEGREVARLRGDADWNSDSARAILQALATAE